MPTDRRTRLAAKVAAPSRLPGIRKDVQVGQSMIRGKRALPVIEVQRKIWEVEEIIGQNPIYDESYDQTYFEVPDGYLAAVLLNFHLPDHVRVKAEELLHSKLSELGDIQKRDEQGHTLFIIKSRQGPTAGVPAKGENCAHCNASMEKSEDGYCNSCGHDYDTGKVPKKGLYHEG